MIRKIIHIDEEKCNGCGACAAACHEGAIEMQNGKARLTREDYCDGLGDCLPACPTGAIAFEEREAPAYDEAAVLAAKRQAAAPRAYACPGTQSKSMSRSACECSTQPSQLSQWPVQLKLVPIHAPYFNGADLLVAADCTAYAYGNFHQDFIRNRITLIGCPKLDEGSYREKLTAILKNNDVKSVTVVRMEVPCCGGMERAAAEAALECGKDIPVRVVVVTTEGSIYE